MGKDQTMIDAERVILDAVTLDEPWSLIESFSKFKREHPRDVNRGMDELAGLLRDHGVEVTVHEPNLYLSLPGEAWVRSGDTTFRAKPSAYSADAAGGLTGRLVQVGASQAGSIQTMFERKFDNSAVSLVRGNIVISEGFANPDMVAQFERMGAIGVIAINPGVDIHWGICTTVWGVPDLDDLPRKPGISACAVNSPDGQRLIEIAKAGGSVTLFSEMEEGWFTSKLHEVFIPDTQELEKYILQHGHLDSWRLTAQEFLETIADYQDRAGARFDLAPAQEAAQTLLTALEAFYADVEAGRIPAAAANAVIQDLARILVPINFTRELRFRHDPAVTIPPLPSIHVATDLDRHDAVTLGFALTQLTRLQNRLVAALGQARRYIALLTG